MEVTEIDKIFIEIEKERVKNLSSVIQHDPYTSGNFLNNLDFNFDNPQSIILVLIILLTSPVWLTILIAFIFVYIIYLFLKEIFDVFKEILESIVKSFSDIKLYKSMYGIKGIKYYVEDITIKERLL